MTVGTTDVSGEEAGLGEGSELSCKYVCGEGPGITQEKREDVLVGVGSLRLVEGGGIHSHLLSITMAQAVGEGFSLRVLSLGVDLRTHLQIWKVTGVDVAKRDMVAPGWEYRGQLPRVARLTPVKVCTGLEPCWDGKRSISFLWTRIGNTEKPEE